MEAKHIKAVYFIGAGGIGMSAIARYFIKPRSGGGRLRQDPHRADPPVGEGGHAYPLRRERRRDSPRLQAKGIVSRGLYASHSGRPPGAGVLPRERLRDTEARTGARHADTSDERSLRGWYPRQDHHVDDVCPHPAPEPWTATPSWAASRRTTAPTTSSATLTT